MTHFVACFFFQVASLVSSKLYILIMTLFLSWSTVWEANTDPYHTVTVGREMVDVDEFLNDGEVVVAR